MHRWYRFDVECPTPKLHSVDVEHATNGRLLLKGGKFMNRRASKQGEWHPTLEEAAYDARNKLARKVTSAQAKLSWARQTQYEFDEHYTP